MTLQLHDYQLAAIKFALEKRATYMMMDLGLGKTAVALKSIAATNLPALVMCPWKVAYNTWVDEIALWTPHLSYAILHGSQKEKELQKNVRIYLLPYSSLKWFYNRCCEGKFKLRKFFVVYDESTFIKSWSTDRWKKYVKRMLPISSSFRMCLSATPVPNGLIDLWTQYFVLDQGQTLGIYPTNYRDRFFIYNEKTYRTTIRPGATKEIYARIAHRTKRLDNKDYLKLPPITYNPIKLDVPRKITEMYYSFKRHKVLKFKSATVIAESAESLLNKLRQLVQGALYKEGGKTYYPLHKHKAEALKEVVDGLNGQSVIVPLQFKFDYDIICSTFGNSLPVIRGGTSVKRSKDLIRNWNKGNIPILLCHPASISHGINLQHGGHNIIWYALPWSLDHFTQLNGRLHRQGQKKGVMINVLLMNLPLEQYVFSVLRRKNATQQDLLDTMKGAI